MGWPRRSRRLGGALALAVVALVVAAEPLGAADVPGADVEGGFEARLSWADPAPGVPVILTLIIYPSNTGTTDGVLSCDQAASTGDRSQTYTQRWSSAYEPVEVDLYVHAFWRCSGDWEEDERHLYRLEIYQLPGYATAAMATTPLLVVEGDAPVGEAMSGMRPTGSPVVARVRVTPADPGTTATSTTQEGSPGGGTGETGATTTTGDSGQVPGGGDSVTTVPQSPGDDGDNSAADQSGPWGALFPGASRGWTGQAVAILILFVTLILLAAGLSIRAAVAGALLTLARDLPALPTAGETARLAGSVQQTLSGLRDVTVEAPVQPRSRPDPDAPPAEFVLQPHQRYIMLGGDNAEPGDWVQVKQGDDVGWVHRSTVQDWRPEDIVIPRSPTPGDYRETILFKEPFEVRNPGDENYTRLGPGSYVLGSPGADGSRPVFGQHGTPLGSIPADRVPPSVPRKAPAPPLPPPP